MEDEAVFIDDELLVAKILVHEIEIELDSISKAGELSIDLKGLDARLSKKDCSHMNCDAFRVDHFSFPPCSFFDSE